MNFVKVLAASLIALFTFAANATTTISAPAPQSTVILTAGTTVVLELAQKVTPKSVSIGNSIRFKVRDNVKVNGKTVIAAGATVIGKVTSLKKTCNGTGASISLQVEDVKTVDGQMIKLNSDIHDMETPCGEPDNSVDMGTILTAEVRDDVKING